MTAGSETSYLNIEQTLKNDKNGEEKRRMIAEFRQQGESIRTQMDQGVSPDEYQRLESIEKGLSTAADVVEQMWARFQQAS